MQTKRIILETDQHGRLLHQPQLPPNIRMEAIFLLPEDRKKAKKRRKPSFAISGKGKILGDIVSPAAPPEDWDILR
ncbi:hypothetical protein GCAAIG_02800 [Candidatus Electronema halotolerans]